MSFSPVFIFITLASFAGVFLLACAWYWRDRRTASSERARESFAVLMSVFFWAAALTFLLKMGLDLADYYDTANRFTNSQWFFVTTLFFEEFIKVAALLIGIEIAGKRFNELSDGVIYTIFAALGFLFFENIFYLLPYAQDGQQLLKIFVGRNLFSFGAHLATTIFGLCYAFAYVYSKKPLFGHRIAPWRLFTHLKILLKQFGALFILWLPFSPFITLYKFFSRPRYTLTVPELLWSGFLLTVYIHIGYDAALLFQNTMLNIAVIVVLVYLVLTLSISFPRLNVRVK